MGRTYAVETFGCQMNVHDSERLAGLLQRAGYEPAAGEEEPALVVVNTCSVRERAAEKLFARLDRYRHRARDERPLVAVTGCVAQQEGSRIVDRAPVVDVVIGTQALAMLPQAIEEAERTRRPQVDTSPYDNVSFPLGVAVRDDPVKAYVTVIEGCNDFCAFCVVPYTRGRERMRPVAEVLGEVAAAAAAGHREVHLLGQIVNHYRAPDAPECDFAGLLERVHEVAGVERIRFASPHPRHVTRRMIEALRDLPKVCKHLHLPVQSGSTRVLGRMRRRHTRERYLALVDEIRAAVTDIALSTDMIVGFPGETAEDFEQTLSLTEAVRYHSMFSFKYSERPNTLARARMPDDVPEAEKAGRLAALQALQQGIQRELHAATVGRTVTVLADAPSRRRDGEFAGRTSGNTIVNFPGDPTCIGRLLDVRIERAGPNSLWGTLSPAVEPQTSGDGVGRCKSR
ncbi:MAG: tRNA (N6-isopentenyl adenosine(37)-C2)-methylthiotransferase MiaB [Acidobacteriota bacterium]|nr:tRNA (N6-isopentenyl adenosine(37)-C2)-methylthiotransferase MiaB [Acidobacteriota bacterium]